MKEKPPVSDDGPKSALELAMERLRKKDKDAGASAPPVTDAQRAAIAEARNVSEAKLAEREILHQSERRKAGDRDALDQLEQEYRRDRERIASERDRKMDEARGD
jgi:hypothetical protein